LVSLFSPEDFKPYAPAEQYRTEDYLVALRRFGMESKLDSAHFIERVNAIAKTNNIELSLKLLQYFEDNNEKLEEDMKHDPTLKKCVLTMKWLPAAFKPENYPLSWFATDHELYPPAELRPLTDVNLVGSIKPLLRVETSKKVSHLLGFDDVAAIGDVAKQLGKVIALPPTPSLSEIILDIYKYLDTVSSSELSTILKGMDKWILLPQHSKFVSIAQVAKYCAFDPSPYLFTLPMDLVPYSNLWKSVGLRDTFDATHYMSILANMKDSYGNNTLPDNMVTLAVKVAEAISECKDIPKEVLVPTEPGNLLLAYQTGKKLPIYLLNR
jgi:hypothetical protein